MKRNVTINKKAYGVKEVTFDAVCELEQLGVSIFDFSNLKGKMFTLSRGCFAFHSGLTLEEASVEIQEHLLNGGELGDFEPFIEAITQTGFFDQLLKSRTEN